MRIGFALACAGFVAGTPGRLVGQGDRTEVVHALDSIAQAVMTRGRVPGLHVMVVYGADTLLHHGYGRADLELDVPTPDDGVYAIGSITKQFTAAAILRLVDQGKVNLDADITTYLPGYPTHGARITIRRLLDHTSGIRGYTELPGVMNRFTAGPVPPDTVIALFKDRPLDFQPGERLSYNNSAYILLGEVIRQASGKPYAAFLREELFEPLGLTRTSYCSNTEVVTGRTHGYAWTRDGLRLAMPLSYSLPYAAGALCSTTRDLVRWTRALHGGRVLRADLYQAMITPEPLTDGSAVSYAMGLGVGRRYGHRRIAHGGGINGFLSDLVHYPDDDLTIAVLINSTGPESPAEVTAAMADRILGREEAPDVALENPERFTGIYGGWGRGMPLRFTISADSTGLTIKIGNGTASPIHHRGGLRFESASESSSLTFILEAGRVTGLYFDGGGIAGHFAKEA